MGMLASIVITAVLGSLSSTLAVTVGVIFIVLGVLVVCASLYTMFDGEGGPGCVGLVIAAVLLIVGFLMIR